MNKTQTKEYLNEKLLKLLLLFSLTSLFSIHMVYSQEIIITKTSDCYSWRLADYTLPDTPISYRIIDSNGGTMGGEMDPADFYEPNYLPTHIKKGKYIMLVYISQGEPIEKSRKILFRKEFKIR